MSSTGTQTTRSKQLFLLDILIILLMAVLAGCGLIYEYLLSHYAGRVLGAVEHAIYTTIGLMIVFMGVGSFAARKIKNAYTGFAWLESIIALIGASAILIIAMLVGLSFSLPQLLADTYGIPADALPRGGIMDSIYQFSRYTPYVFAAILGLFIGMEIPLIARVREHLHQRHLTHNAGTIYGADYIGAGIGAAIWVGWMMTLEISQAAVFTASLNWVAGTIVLIVFWQEIGFKKWLAGFHLLLLVFILLLAKSGDRWMQQFTDMLYLDKAVYQTQTHYQQVVLTERYLGADIPSIINLFLNGRLQFSSSDEKIYHEMLVHPVMAASARHQHILVIGGGDSLAVREILKWQPESIDLIDLDAQVVDLFRHPEHKLPPRLAQRVSRLTQSSFTDERVHIKIDDAFNAVDKLLKKGKYYDSIIVDLPDPNHPDLNKLYTNYFYLRLNQLLSADGALVIQSTSPYHARKAFISIGKTLSAAGFSSVEQYHQNVPSFGEWGWTIASKQGQGVSQRLKANLTLPSDVNWVTESLILASFEFPAHFYDDYEQIKTNELGSQVLFEYHFNAWQTERGRLTTGKLNE
ncbi:polyamine aminopropyltransferase [Catenovulum adriaticum]|uniref:Polyamine aminopropyltransferase n=1 Tax=Catenovulum adriaticum TaxID=2984846 RepID=A0ABY7AM08_9ALTE|nr:polyamine aminopropyltransferase [Catenovulum sp. TS8]WAJ70335.1 polyamine aminopropyltransferase [Catenovulum sp. TS8]